MTRLLACTFALLYFVTTSGVTMGLHFCGNSLSSLSFYNDKAPVCSCSGKVKKPKKACCTQSTVTIKLKTEHKTTSVPSLSALWTNLARPVQELFIMAPSFTEPASRPDPSPPPGPRPRHLMLSVFLI